MEFSNTQTQSHDSSTSVHFGHLGLVLGVAVLLVGISWMKNPAIFNFSKTANANLESNVNVPKYYAYVPPAEDLPQPLVAGASTQSSGPSIINEDGTVTSALDAGSVLGASTANVQLPLDQVKVKEIPDSDAAIKQYFSDSQNIESSYINNTDFETALSSGNQKLIDAQSQKILDIKNNLQKLAVPHSLVNLQKLKIVQYAAAVNILNNFTQADANPELVGQYLDQFLKSQQDLESENINIQEKYGIDLGYSSAN